MNHESLVSLENIPKMYSNGISEANSHFERLPSWLDADVQVDALIGESAFPQIRASFGPGGHRPASGSTPQTPPSQCYVVTQHNAML